MNGGGNKFSLEDISLTIHVISKKSYGSYDCFHHFLKCRLTTLQRYHDNYVSDAFGSMGTEGFAEWSKSLDW